MLHLPANARDVLRYVVAVSLERFPPAYRSLEAKMLLLAIGAQESGYAARDQWDRTGMLGPALGLWQFERIACTEILTHSKTSVLAALECAARNCQPVTMDVWRRLSVDDVMACSFARLLLWRDPTPLPSLGDYEGAWAYYVRNWKPGKPHRVRWNHNYNLARMALEATTTTVAA